MKKQHHRFVVGSGGLSSPLRHMNEEPMSSSGWVLVIFAAVVLVGCVVLIIWK